MKINGEVIGGLALWTIIVGAVVATGANGCKKDPTPTAPPAATSRPGTFEGALDMVLETKAVSGPDGIYLIDSKGVWLLRGAEAVRVHEVPALSPR